MTVRAETEHRPDRPNTPESVAMLELSKVLANGLTHDQDDDLDDFVIALSRIRERIALMPFHRSLSLAVTKIEEAQHWLRDRKVKPPSLVSRLGEPEEG